MMFDRLPASRRWQARLVAGLVFVLGSASAASAQGLGSALEVYADGLVMQRAAALGCGGATMPDGEAENWNKARGIFVATLWAHNLPAAVVNSVSARLYAEPAPAPDCADKRLLEVARSAAKDGDWVGSTGYVLKQLDLAPVPDAPTVAQWDDLELAFAEEIKLQERMLACIAVRYPIGMPDAVKFWDDLVIGVTGQMALRGFPRDDIETLLGKSLSQAIWTPVTGDAATALKADCEADTAWYDRWGIFGYAALRGKVETILGSAPQ